MLGMSFRVSPLTGDATDVKIRGRFTLGVIPSVPEEHDFVFDDDEEDGSEVILGAEAIEFKSRNFSPGQGTTYTVCMMPSDFLQDLGSNPEMFLKLEIFPLQVNYSS